jgi:hypothetical protein
MTGVGGPELRRPCGPGRVLGGAAFCVALAGAASAAFIGGWLAGWIAGRFGSDARPGGGGGLLGVAGVAVRI